MGAIWQEAVEMGFDVAAAIHAAILDGTLSPLQCLVVLLHDFGGYTLREVGDGLGLSEDQAKRLHKRALRAIRGTGVLDAYDGRGRRGQGPT